MDQPAPHFSPLRTPSIRWRIGAALVGPLLWVVAIGLLALVQSERRAIALGLLIAGVSFLLALLLLLPSRRMRIREEREVDGAGRR
jgi:hypothetical protein